LIGAEKYHRASHLQYTVNDVRRLSDTLRSRGDFTREHMLELTDAAANPCLQPLKASLVAEIPKWLKKPEPEDIVLIYFSGHGFQDADSKLYLAPLDCDPDNPASTGIPAQWLREQIAACRARFKLLIIDSCHAGSEKGKSDQPGVAARDLGQTFHDLGGVVMLASSKADEKSQIWEDREQSLFSYWLRQGLAGHADENSDSQVDVDELYKYVHRQVTHTAAVRFPRPQTPVRVVRSDTPDVPVVVHLQPQGLRQVLDDMAEQMALAMEERQLPKVGVLEFTNDTKLGELLGANFGILGKWCAEELERRLIDYGTGKFSVVDRDRLKAALTAQRFSVHDLASAKSLERLSNNVGGMPVIIRGTLTGRDGRQLSLRTKLSETEGDEVLAAAGGAAQISESEYAMIVPSVHVDPDDRPELVIGGRPNVTLDEQVIRRNDERATGPHPLTNPRFPFRLRIMIDGKERLGVSRGSDWFVPVRQGEVYEIWVENHTDETVLMRLLVDGLNTLPQRDNVKGLGTFLTAPRVNLDEARRWILDPHDAGTLRLKGIPTWAVRGFVTSTGTHGQGKLREFVVVEAAESLAGRQQFTDQLGIITAAFYSPASDQRTVGTAAGRERIDDLRQGEPTEVGSLLDAFQVRYVEADSLK
jgi:hypothetical protein